MTGGGTYYYDSSTKQLRDLMPRAAFYRKIGDKRYRIQLEWMQFSVAEDLDSALNANSRRVDPEVIVRLMRKLAEQILAAPPEVKP